MRKYIEKDLGLRYSEIRPGTVRITASRLKVREKTKTSWKRSSRIFPEAMLIIRLFRKNGRFSYLIDKKDPTFLKGQLTPKGSPGGARIGILPNGKKLNKAFGAQALPTRKKATPKKKAAPKAKKPAVKKAPAKKKAAAPKKAA